MRVKLPKIFRKKRVLWGTIIGLVVIIIALIFIVGGGNGNDELFVAERRDVVEQVRIAGRVEADIVADMGFDVSGRVRRVHVKVGDTVRVGTPLVSLSAGTLFAELRAAEADVLLARANTTNTQVNIDEIQKQQDTLVANAYRTLLSNGLVAEPDADSYTVTPPIIGGTYDGPEGTYDIQVETAPAAGTYEILIFGTEQLEPVRIKANTPVALGTRGLTISFPDNLFSYLNTIWHVNIPNPESSSYTANYNAYVSALRTRDKEIAAAQSQVRQQDSGTSVTEAELARAQANRDRIAAELAKYTLRAPFAGVVTRIDANLGEIVNTSNTAVSLITNQLGIEVDLPEIDSVKVSVGDSAAVTFDAFDSAEDIPAHVASVNRTETIVDGVPVYEARLSFDTADPRIVSGMTTNVTITTDTRKNVVALPARAIQYRENGEPYVRVLREDETVEEKTVLLGLRGSDSFTEIKSGVSEGDTVLISNES